MAMVMCCPSRFSKIYISKYSKAHEKHHQVEVMAPYGFTVDWIETGYHGKI